MRKIIDTPIKSAESPKTPGSKKREKYTVYSPRDRAAIGKFCAENGPVAAVRKFSKDFPSLSESTVRGMRKKYQESLVSRKRKLDFDENDCDVTEIFPKKRGRPFLVGNELDSKLQKYLYVLRENGAVINTQIVIAAGKGIITGKDKTLLSENGGHLDLTKSWAKSLLQRMNFV